jgi:hypothetical protein
VDERLFIDGSPDEVRAHLEGVFGTPAFRLTGGVVELELPLRGADLQAVADRSVTVRVPLIDRWSVVRPLRGPLWHAAPEGSDQTLCTIDMTGWISERLDDDTQDVTCPWCRVRLIALEIVSPPGPRDRGVRSPSSGFVELTARMDELADELGLVVVSGSTGRNYRPAVRESGASVTSGIGVYSSSRGVEFNLQVFRDLGEDAAADDLANRIRRMNGGKPVAPKWPAVPCSVLIRDWMGTRAEVIEPYFRARATLSEGDPGGALVEAEAVGDATTNRGVALLGIGAVTSQLEQRGATVRVTGESRFGNTLAVVTPAGGRYAIYVKSKRRGDWQTDTKFAVPREPDEGESRFWALVDLASVDAPRVYLVPEWWMQNDIYEAHQRYLDAHGGRRAETQDSTHHAIRPSRVEPWSERWDLLGL